MAGFRSIPGSGYGNAYIDALIAGGAVWDTSSEPLSVFLRQSVSTEASWDDIHGPPR